MDERQHEAYFCDQLNRSTPEFWRRFGVRPDFAGKHILELGCGHGALALEMARNGGHVLGLDLDQDRIRFARANVEPLSENGTLEFRVQDVRTVTESFDLIVSKDTFEHIDDLPGVLRALRRQLAPQGEIWTGFSPLYYSPRGDHGRTGMKLPWAHTLPRPLVFAAASRHRGIPVSSLADIGLNGLTPAEFRQSIADAGLEVKSARYNAGDRRSLQLLSRFRSTFGLERYLTVSIYAVLVGTSS